MYSCDLTLELTESVEVDVRVHYACTDPGCKGDHIDPGCSPEFEVEEIEILILYGKDWEKSGDELCAQGFYQEVRKACNWALDAYPDLYEHQLDTYESYVFEPYWD